MFKSEKAFSLKNMIDHQISTNESEISSSLKKKRGNFEKR
jgi:hypothetical protein